MMVTGQPPNNQPLPGSLHQQRAKAVRGHWTKPPRLLNLLWRDALSAQLSVLPAFTARQYFPFERQNLTMRMQIRRLTRSTDAFSRKWENLRAALALYFAWYNYCKFHRTLRSTPAMAAGITDHIWSITELFGGHSMTFFDCWPTWCKPPARKERATFLKA
jgi:hypothetical protein